MIWESDLDDNNQTMHMTNWSPREAMTTLSYLKFKAGRWAKVKSVPDWVHNHKPTYTKGRTLYYDGDRKIYEKEVWVGESLKYMMKWEPVAQKEVELVGMYTQIK